ncbi:Electron-transferring-flavoprotein dehydrogenase [Chloroherpeton thalassium ATCC 35110]|uniref:Electron transfer flavoprotein-ubiquinone oxidoreductase n=1 Tax=Chloroherpeton thalassium (strain ATCC 35110 / GB-78) TaxID=517418 RepID=B3QUN7_CHLT3|nr:electron transfer flavoprotein-ubiquinone oxidoreductase [Chloroherpeton thalassium]ACF12943.1 Electron-transferring-flavoprotein dehydrogenase [Chloroherpeton thalassium ATCC 35110]
MSLQPQIERETLEMDVLFVGAGPANLAAAIRLKQLIDKHNETASEKLDPEIALIEKGKSVGAHLLSGAILDTRALKELIPDYIEKNCPIEATVEQERVFFLTEEKKFNMPFLPASFKNHGSPLISLSKFGKWLGKMAEEMGINLFEGIAGAEPIIENGQVLGVRTDDKGRDKNGQPKPNFEPGMNIHAKVTVLGEGARGSLTKKIARQLSLEADATPQAYETGVKEIWEIPSGRIKKGTAIHSFGFPLPATIYGGGWIYALSETRLSIGFVTALDAADPTNDPHFNLQRFKTHPFVRELLNGGTLIGYGAKAISGGGYASIPKLFANGLLLTGESGGFLNSMRLKGIHLSMKSGMLAAETIFDALKKKDFSEETLKTYREAFEQSWAKEELYEVRNFRQAFNYGLYSGAIRVGLQQLFSGRLVAKQLDHDPDHMQMEHFHRLHRARYLEVKADFKYDGKLTFDKLTDLYESGTTHEENQPCHLFIVPDLITDICNTKCTVEYGNPCQFFCPAKVYEMVVTDEKMGTKKLHLNPANCVHCKTCDIADPYQVITWKVPEGGGGPNYNKG